MFKSLLVSCSLLSFYRVKYMGGGGYYRVKLVKYVPFSKPTTLENQVLTEIYKLYSLEPFEYCLQLIFLFFFYI